ncbi:MAG: hypothetical protein JWP85_1094 [Rhodoglobus sp.]|nr:hypothetical protein [Rhodoglobus sp.]
MTKPHRWVVLEGVRRSDRVGQAVAHGLMGGIGAGIVDVALFLPGLLMALVGGFIGGTSRQWALSTRVEANFELGVIRRGRRSAAFHDLDFATLGVDGAPAHRLLELRFGARDKLDLVAPLRDGERILLPHATRDALALVIEASSVRLPVDRYDPQGRFARYNFPENVTREEAIALVLDPPAPGDSLPNGREG